MSNTIKIKRGTEANLPTLEAGELGFTTDTYKVYIGDGTDNHLVTGIAKVEDDPNPKLGGNLDSQTYKIVGEGGSEGIYIDSNGNIGVGTVNPTLKFEVVNEEGSATIVATRYFNSATAGGEFRMRQARGTESSPSTVQENDRLGVFLFSGHDGSSFQNPAGIMSYVDGTVSSGAVPARITFETGTAYLHRGERLTLTSNGNIGFNTTDQFGSGVKVIGIANASTVPSSNPTGGGVLYVEEGILKYRSSSGDITSTEDINNHLINTTNPHSVTKTQIGLSNVENILNNYSATAAPTVNDDSGSGYTVGSRWIDTTNDDDYVCLDALAGAAVWKKTTP